MRFQPSSAPGRPLCAARDPIARLRVSLRIQEAFQEAAGPPSAGSTQILAPNNYSSLIQECKSLVTEDPS